MTESEELELISYSILKYMMDNSPLSRKHYLDIFNEWSNSTNITIQHQSNLRWALRFIKTYKNNIVLKSPALNIIMKEKEKERKENGVY